MDMTSVDDTTLIAYVDGELDAATARVVEAEIRLDPDLELRVRRLRESAALVRAAVNEPCHGPVPDELIQAVSGSGTPPAPVFPRRRWLAAAGIVGLVAAGFGAGYLLGGPASGMKTEIAGDEDLVDEIVAYHEFYAALPPATATGPADPRVMEKWLSQHMHQRVRIPDLSGEGFRFQTARLFVYEEQVIAQIVYEPEAGPPVALCVTASGEGARRLKTLHRHGITVLTWRQGGSQYFVVGAAPATQLRRLSTEISDHLHQT